jgi:hypothetical protein
MSVRLSIRHGVSCDETTVTKYIMLNLCKAWFFLIRMHKDPLIACCLHQKLGDKETLCRKRVSAMHFRLQRLPGRDNESDIIGQY